MSFYLGMLAYYGVIVCASVVSHGCRHMFQLVRAHCEHSEELLEYMQSIQYYQIDTKPKPTCDAPVEYKQVCSTAEMTQFAQDNPLCSICMDTHPMDACTRTVCGHVFGQTCFHRWIATATATATTATATAATATATAKTATSHVRCPNCAQDVTSVTTYCSSK